MRPTNSSLPSFIFRARCRKLLTYGSRFEKGIKEVCTEQGANKEPQIPSLPFSCCLFNCSSPHTILSLFAPAYAKKIASVSKAIHSTLAAKGFRQIPSQSFDDLIHHLIISLLFPASNKCGNKKNPCTGPPNKRRSNDGRHATVHQHRIKKIFHFYYAEFFVHLKKAENFQFNYKQNQLAVF